jgi:predicted ATP-grasp superfamily ATP-dependent carboligase
VRKPRAFVTDGSYVNALAAVRALGQAGTEVTVGERANIPRIRRAACWSRYSANSFSYPAPNGSCDETAAALKQLFSREEYDAFIPVGLTMTELAVHHAHEFQVPAMLPNPQSFAVAVDKRRTFQLAQHLGIPAPVTVDAAEYGKLGLPCVIKHRRSGAFIAHRAEDLDEILGGVAHELEQYLAQEYIPGRNGYGYFGFFFERLMQWPIEGGPSVVARSFYADELREYGRCMLAALNWTGVAMVEFKRSSRDEKFYLIEINPKYWGSLDLAIHAGCNFPVWTRDFLLHKEPKIPQSYRMDTTFHWVVPNGLRCLMQYPEYRKTFLRNVLSRKVKSEFSIADPLPTIMQVVAQLGLGS